MTPTREEVIRVALECELQSHKEHWGTVYRVASPAALEKFAQHFYEAGLREFEAKGA